MKRQNARRKIVNLSTMVDVFMIVIFWYIMFSNQKLTAQEIDAQGAMDAMRTKYEKEIGELNNDLNSSFVRNEELDANIKVLLEQIEQLKTQVKKMQQEIDSVKTAGEKLLGEKEKLTGENEELKAMMNEEGSVMLLQLSAVGSGYYRLEYAYKGVETEIVFVGKKDGEKITEFLSEQIGTALNDGKIHVVFIYGDNTLFSADVELIDDTIRGLQTENFFIYNKINLRQSNGGE